ncbi:MAG: FAD-binding oxidoreductase [Thermocladium sp.]|jgi:glycine/D-amino acid oxidase-like deaminating enzyme
MLRAIVIGGGIAGSFISHFLQETGVDVLMISEKTSYPPIGLIHSMLLRFDTDMELAKRTLEIYRSLDCCSWVLKEYPAYTFIGEEVDINKYIRLWSSYGSDSREITIEEASKLMGIKLMPGGRAIISKDRLVNIAGIVNHIRSRVKVINGFARLKRNAAGFSALVNGTEYRGDIIIVAAGAINGKLLGDAGVSVPLKSYGCRALLLLVGPKLDKAIIYDYVNHFYMRPATPLTASIGDEESPLVDPLNMPNLVTPDFITSMKNSFKSRFGKTPISLLGRQGACESSPDMFPIIGEAATDLYIMGALNGYGAEIGPALAEALVSIVLGGKPRLDVSRYLLSRYAGAVFPSDWEIGHEPHEVL